jgi:exonuclease VII large subunit
MRSIFLFLVVVFWGGWSCLQASEVSGETPVYDANDLNALIEAVGNRAVVEGIVNKVGTTQDGRITFINLGSDIRQTFVAVVHERYYDLFPEGFRELEGQKVRIHGDLEVYRENQPQIRIHSAEQIERVED